MSDAKAAPPSFENALERLEHIVRTLEDGELPLDNALELFEEGIGLSRFCHGKLAEAERRVEILLRGESGELEAVPFGNADQSGTGMSGGETSGEISGEMSGDDQSEGD